MSPEDGLEDRWDAALSAGEVDAVLAAFEHAPGVLAFAEGPDLVLSAVNAVARETYGMEVGDPLEQAFPAPGGSELAERVREVFGSGEPDPGKELRFELEDADTTVVYLLVRLTPGLRGDGSVRGVVLQAVDVTEQVRARQAAAARSMDDQRRVRAAKETLMTLQDALLPDGLPIAPGVDLAARYLFAEDGDKAGGDWFDAVALPDGRVVLVVGDVVGHGVRASVVMGELRTLFDERIREGGDLRAALELLEGRATRTPQARATTLCAAVLDPTTGSLTYCTAGHPPPLVVTTAGEALFLPVTGAGPLGSALPLRLGSHQLDAGDVVLFYSDGLVQRPGRSPVQNTLDLARIAADVAREPGAGRVEQRLCRETVERLTEESGFEDDITVLAAHLVPTPETLEMTVPAFPDTLRAVRQALGEWLTAVGIGQLDELALQHAVGELVSNSVEHAYPPDSPRHEAVVTVRAELLPGGVVQIEVSDRGTWQAPGPSHGRGRGLAMASGFSDELEVTHDERGTRAVLRQRPSAGVDLLASAGSSGTPDHAPMQVRQDDGVVEILGALDHRSSDELRRRLSHATRGGTIDVVVDLSGVTLLASSGVQVLFEEMLPGLRPSEHPGVRLVAPPGCPAQHVLELVQLPYAAERPAG